MRARVIAAYDIAGVRARGDLDDLVGFAAELCAAPIALISLVEEKFQRFLARRGTDLDATPRSMSFCAHAMLGDAIMEVPDTLRDPRFADSDMVIGEAGIRFYAGAPLVSSEGVPLGAVCVLDTMPRDGLTALQRNGLSILAKAVMGRLDDHRIAREQGEAAVASRHALASSEQRFRTLADTMPQMVWSTLPDGFHDYYNARWYEFTGMPAGSTDGEAWNGVFHPDDQDRAWTIWRRSLATGDPYQIEYRLRHHDGTYRWVLGRALPIRDADGAITRWFGTCTDVHAQKLAMEEREVISQELSHRIKNIFSVVAGLIGFAARGRPDMAGIANDLRERITALGRAHDFVRPHSAQSRPAAPQDSLHGLLADLFLPYQNDDGRLAVTGEDIRVDDRSATPIALLFHELATNATKYGALSALDGHVDIDVERHGDAVRIVWTETGGPPPVSDIIPAGFGSQLIEMSVIRQLGGTVDREWRPAGLVMTIDVPLASFSRP